MTFSSPLGSTAGASRRSILGGKLAVRACAAAWIGLAFWCGALSSEVGALQDQLERGDQWLTRSNEFRAGLVSHGFGNAPESWDPAMLASPSLAEEAPLLRDAAAPERLLWVETAAGLTTALHAEDRRATALAAARLVPVHDELHAGVRRRQSQQFGDLGRHWSQLYLLAVIALAGGAALVLLVTRVQRQRRSLTLATQRAEESHRRFRELFEANPAVHLLVDAETGVVVDGNRAAAAFYGLDQGELRGRLFPVFERTTIDACLVGLAEAADGEPDSGDRHHHLDDGESRVVERVVARTTVEGRPTYSVTVHDVTTHREQLTDLREQHDFARTMVDAAGCLSVVVDRDGCIARWGHACEELTGRPERDVRGQPFAQLFVEPHAAEDVARTYADLDAATFPLRRASVWLDADGHERLVVWQSAALLDPAGRVRYVIETGIDATHPAEFETGDVLRAV